MEAYDEADRKYAAAMQFDREDGNGDRLFTYPVRGWDDGPGASKQEYFYRAMERDEASGWLAPFRTAEADANGHHPWASFRKYSLRYLIRRHGYTYLLEVYAPDFITDMKSIGFTGGKAEDGDMSWGIGGTNSNSWNGSKDTNKVLEKMYGHVFNRDVNVNPKDVKGGLRKMAVKLSESVFKQNIKWVKVVNLRSQKPE